MVLGSSPIGSTPLGAGPERRNPENPKADNPLPLGVKSEYVEDGYVDGGFVAEVVKPTPVQINDAFIGHQADSPELRSNIPASSWTGRPTAGETARAVRALAPSALEGVDFLIAELEGLGGNGGPGAKDVQDALNSLRELRDALSALIKAVEHEAALDEPLGQLAECASQVLKWSKNNFEVSVSGFALVGIKATVALGVAAAVNHFNGGGGEVAGAYASELVGGLVQPKAKKAGHPGPE